VLPITRNQLDIIFNFPLMADAEDNDECRGSLKNLQGWGGVGAQTSPEMQSEPLGRALRFFCTQRLLASEPIRLLYILQQLTEM
jgi:hypothetical protein